jgi:hypothetical protein
MDSSRSIEVWPENWPAFQLFCQLQTQWRAGAAGLIGLDYNTLYRKLDRLHLTDQQYEDWEADIQTMEYAALAVMNEEKD